MLNNVACNISNARKSDSSGFQNTKKWALKNEAQPRFFQPTSRCLDA